MDELPHGKGWDLWSTSEEWASIGGGPSLLRKNAAHGSFSPDGTTIVYLDRPRIQGWTFGAGSIWLMDADGSDPRPLVEGDAMAWPRWSPDGTRIAYEDGGQIYVVDVATGDADALADGGAPEWLDDDTLIVSPV